VTTEEKKTVGLGFLGEILVRHGVVSAERLSAALEEQRGRGGRLGAVLVEAGFCTEEQIARALASQFRVAFEAPSPETADGPAAEKIGHEFLRRHGIVPFRGADGKIALATADPLDVEPLDRALALLGSNARTVVSLRRDVAAALDHLGRAGVESGGDSGGGAAPAAVARIDDRKIDAAAIVEELIQKGVRGRATDIHFEPEETAFRVRYRVDGILRQGGSFPKEYGPLVVSRLKILSELDVCEHRLPQDGRARFESTSGVVDLRVSILPTIYGEGCVLRVLDKARGVVAPSKLGVAERILDPLVKLMDRSHGLVLVTGPTGSGKTTTLYSLLSTVDAMARKVITVEDPVEYRFPLVRQVQVLSDIGLTFASALRSILRHDPEVVLIGEIRDRETAEIATRAALTGHLVLSTLHTNSAVGAVPRLLDMGVDPFLVTATVAGIVGQRLTRRLCAACSVPDPVPEHEKSQVPRPLREVADGRRKPVGCVQCNKTGFSGRLGLHELVLPDDMFKTLTMRRESEATLTVAAASGGYLPMSFDGWEKVLQGLTTHDEVKRVTM
jgi:type II secretory ATPase GspE/PulE/Tfp pilus assembly ATPase PilB-like protein